MQNPIEKADVNFTDTVKKEWSAPVFEIISKEIIQSGSHGPESSSAAGS